MHTLIYQPLIPDLQIPRPAVLSQGVLDPPRPDPDSMLEAVRLGSRGTESVTKLLDAL